MWFFDYLYYLVYKFYANRRESGAEGTGVSFVAGLMTLNLITLFHIAELIVRKKTWLNPFWIIGVFLLIFIFFYRRYLYSERYSANAIEGRWLAEAASARKWKKELLLLYGILSAIAGIGLAVYVGTKKW